MSTFSKGFTQGLEDIKFNGAGLGEALGQNIGAISSAVGGLAGGLIGDGYSSQEGNILNTVGDIGGMIPGPWGAAIGGGAKLVGGLVNRAFGTKVNQEALNAANQGTDYLSNFESNASNFDDVRGPQTMAAVSDVYKGGWFSKGAARRKNAELRRQRLIAQDWADRSVENNIDNLVDGQMDNLLANYAAFGGPLNPYSAGALVDAIYSSSNGDKFLGKPSHNYDFTISEEEANKLGYYPDERGHRDDRVKKPTHPTHTSRGKWNSFEEFRLTDKGMENPNYTLFGLVDGGQDPQAVMTYKGGIVLPEITVTPKESYIMNPYDNIKIFDKGGSLTNRKSSSRRLNNNYKEGEIYDVTEEEVKLLKELGYEFEYV